MILADGELTANNLTSVIQDYHRALPAGFWGNWVVGNHDNHRVLFKVGNDTQVAMALYGLVFTLGGTPITYNGDEIGMTDTFIPYDKCRDPACINNNKTFTIVGRDPERTPLQWACATSAGFSSNDTTWLPVNPDYCQASQRTAPAQHTLNTHKRTLSTH